MRISTAAAVLALICLSTAPSSVFAKKTHVLVISGETEFEKAVKENPFLVVEFFAPWCGHCKKLAPEWEKAAETLKGGEPAIVLASVDATEEPNKVLAEKYGIKGFPTIKMFRDGDAKSPIDYDGPREATGIVSTLKKQSGPAVKTLADADAVKEFRTLSAEREVVVIGVFPEGEASEEAAAYKAAASALRTDYEFGLVSDAALVPEAKGAKGATIVLLKSFDEPATTYGGKLEKKAVRDWVELTGTPTYAILDQDPKNRRVVQKVFADPKAKILAFGDAEDAAWAPVKEALITASKALASEYNFIIVENAGNDGALDYFGLKAPDTPAFVIHDQAGDAKFVSKNAGAEALLPWLEQFKAGKLVKVIKSEEAPETNDGPVTVLTANTFDEIVTLGKNVMIEFYAPWCGHCKSLAPVYEKVGEAFQDDPTVIVAKMDATANDIKDGKKFPVKGFPTLMFVTADGNVLTFDGERTEEGLIEYIKSHSDSATKDGEAAKDEL